ncbi:MAG: hypothetical protein ABWZ56_00045 [Flavobacterium sp.]
MKKVFIVSTVLMGFIVSCKKEKPEEVIPVIAEPVVVEETISEECYQGILKKDTISMTLNLNGNQVSSGKLSYKFFEKDSNEGTLSGELKGDTLIADYTFMSEGTTSVRQVAFLKKGNTYIEGYGDIIDDNGKVRFKNTKQLNFDSKTILSKVDCQK